MRWQAKHDRDAFKEIWLAFENSRGRFPLYPSESVWIEYAYSVSDTKWGPLVPARGPPAHRAPAGPARFPHSSGSRRLGHRDVHVRRGVSATDPACAPPRPGCICFTWSTASPALHARYRLEWRFRNRTVTWGAR